MVNGLSQWISVAKHRQKARVRAHRKRKRSTVWYLAWIPFPITFPKLRLSHQLLGFFVVVLLFPLLLLSFSIYGINQKALKKQVAQFTEHTAAATYAELSLEMSWQKDEALIASEYWKTFLSFRSVKQQQAHVDAFFLHYPAYEAVAFYDEAGKPLFVYRSPETAYASFEVPQTISHIPKHAQFQLLYNPQSQPQSQLKKRPDMNYSLQITLPETITYGREHHGAIVFIKHFPYLGNLIHERFNTFQSGFVIVNREGSIIAGPPNLVSQKLPAEDWYLFQNLPEGVMREFSTHEQHYGMHIKSRADKDDPHLDKVFIKVPELGWGLIIESPYQIQRTYILSARNQSVLLVFLCILLVIVLGLLYSQGINRNFRQMIKGVKALAEGRYSRKIRLITKSWTPYEIVYLTAEVNRMANKISTAWSSIQKLNQELVFKNQQDLFIAQAIQRLHGSLDLDRVCQTATDILAEHPGVRATMLYLCLVEGEQYELAAQSQAQAKQALTNSETHTMEEPVDLMVLNQVLANQNALTDGVAEIGFLPGKLSIALEPVIYMDTLVGRMVVVRTKSVSESETPIFDDALSLRLLLTQIGVAIHQAYQWQQLQHANQQLAKLDEMKSNLIDTVSHELRTPLTNIKGYTSRLLRYDDALDHEMKVKSLKVIKQQTDRLSRLVEDLLVIPDLERQDGIRVFPDRVNLLELFNRCIAFIHEKENREIEILGCPATLNILVDPDRMEQVVVNLLDNAIKYSDENTVIEVSAFQTKDNRVQIQVFNQCEPIPPDQVITLFTKFRRLDERLTRTTRGTGLGLFITKGLLEAMSGNIRIEGNDGFRVIMEVPLAEEETEVTEAESPPVFTREASQV